MSQISRFFCTSIDVCQQTTTFLPFSLFLYHNLNVTWNNRNKCQIFIARATVWLRKCSFYLMLCFFVCYVWILKIVSHLCFVFVFMLWLLQINYRKDFSLLNVYFFFAYHDLRYTKVKIGFWQSKVWKLVGKLLEFSDEFPFWSQEISKQVCKMLWYFLNRKSIIKKELEKVFKCNYFM